MVEPQTCGGRLPDELYAYIREMVPLICVDAVVTHNQGVLLVQRTCDPFRGYWALPGGHIELGETAETAVLRELKEETDIQGEVDCLVGIYSDPNRNPWGHIVSICYLVRWVGGEVRPSSEVSDIRLFQTMPPNIGFDHREMIQDALDLREWHARSRT